MIAAYHGRKPSALVIRFFNRSTVSHVSWLDPDDYEIEARLKCGVRRVEQPLADHPRGTRVDIYDMEYTDEQLRKIRRFLTEQIGKRYDLVSVARFVTRRPERARDQGRWFCSEILFAAHLAAGIHLLKRVPAWKVYPGMLLYSPLLTRIGTVYVGEQDDWMTLAPITDGEALSGPRIADSREGCSATYLAAEAFCSECRALCREIKGMAPMNAQPGGLAA